MRLRTLNTILLSVIIVINSYILLTPLLPRLLFLLSGESAITELQKEATSPNGDFGGGVGADNVLIVPAMKLKESVHEVKSTHTIRNDVWRRPNTSTPDKGGNTVIVGHRFTYTNPTGVFYHLDKIKLGDTLALSWQGKRYIYTVDRITTVPASASDVEAPTDNDQLTLYSCTPLWNPKQRLVVVANLEKVL